MGDRRAALDDIEDEDNGHTVVAGLSAPRIRYADFATLFEIQYQAIRREHGAVTLPGVLSLAFDLGNAELAATRLVKARTGSLDAMTIGRHSRCELSLFRDRSVSLRHLAVLVRPLDPHEQRMRFRVVDLHTSLGFMDCFGNRVQAVEADGPAMIAISRYVVLLLPTGGFRLPDSVQQAWDMVADPLYLEYRTEYQLKTWDSEEAGDSLAPRRSESQAPSTQDLDEAKDSSRPGRNTDSLRTSFALLDGPQRPSTPLVADGQALGVLEVEAAGELRRLSIDPIAADRGLLIGSYERCDDPCLTHVNHPAISRVHLLVIRSGAELFAIDTASSNGSFVEAPDGRRVRMRVAKLTPGLELSLADYRARLRWSPAS
jgi:hypothetical protein